MSPSAWIVSSNFAAAETTSIYFGVLAIAAGELDSRPSERSDTLSTRIVSGAFFGSERLRVERLNYEGSRFELRDQKKEPPPWPPRHDSG